MTENPWAGIIGPCYATASLARALGWTDAEVLSAADDLRVLALNTDDGKMLYPAFQVHDGHIVDGLHDVLRVLQTGTQSRWPWAQWLNTEVSDEDPPLGIQALIDGRHEEMLRAARHDAWAWGS